LGEEKRGGMERKCIRMPSHVEIKTAHRKSLFSLLRYSGFHFKGTRQHENIDCKNKKARTSFMFFTFYERSKKVLKILMRNSFVSSTISHISLKLTQADNFQLSQKSQWRALKEMEVFVLTEISLRGFLRRILN
jgi:hypothetical protein